METEKITITSYDSTSGEKKVTVVTNPVAVENIKTFLKKMLDIKKNLEEKLLEKMKNK